VHTVTARAPCVPWAGLMVLYEPRHQKHLHTYILTYFGCVSIVDCPESVTITPSSGPYTEGNYLTCTADGYPEPSYEWTDETGAVVSSSRTTRLLAGLFNLTCTATGNITTPCSASNTISGIGKQQCHEI